MDEMSPNSTTIPSDPTTITGPPIQKPSKPPPQADLTALQKLRLYLIYTIRRTTHRSDAFLLRLSRLLSTPNGIDVTLCTISYTLTLIRALSSRILERRLSSIATTLAAKAHDVLLPGETLIASLPAPASTKILAQVVGSSKALADTIGEYRIFVRLWGMLGIYTWARATYSDPLPATASSRDKLLRRLDWTAVATCVGFQVLENGAYLSSKGALTSVSWTGDVGKARENQWWLWSSRFWAAYVAVEIVKLGVVRLYSGNKSTSNTTTGTQDDGEKEDKLKREEEVKQTQLANWLWWKDLVSNMAYAPMTIHWSLEQGLLPEWGVGACGMVAGGALLADSWRRAA